MNARANEPKSGEATVVSMPRAEKSPVQSEAPAQQQPATPPAALVEAAPKKKGSRRLVLMIAVPLVLVLGGGYFWLNGGRYQDTDNAYVQADTVQVAPQITGYVSEVLVSDNQVVQPGQVLVRLDPAEAQAATGAALDAVADEPAAS